MSSLLRSLVVASALVATDSNAQDNPNDQATDLKKYLFNCETTLTVGGGVEAGQTFTIEVNQESRAETWRLLKTDARDPRSFAAMASAKCFEPCALKTAGSFDAVLYNFIVTRPDGMPLLDGWDKDAIAKHYPGAKSAVWFWSANNGRSEYFSFVNENYGEMGHCDLPDIRFLDD